MRSLCKVKLEMLGDGHCKHENLHVIFVARVQHYCSRSHSQPCPAHGLKPKISHPLHYFRSLPIPFAYLCTVSTLLARSLHSICPARLLNESPVSLSHVVIVPESVDFYICPCMVSVITPVTVKRYRNCGSSQRQGNRTAPSISCALILIACR